MRNRNLWGSICMLKNVIILGFGFGLNSFNNKNGDVIIGFFLLFLG